MLWYIHQRAIFAIRQYRRCGPVHVNKWTGVIFAWMSALLKNCLYHTVIPPWIYRIPSELRSQAGLGLPSTVVGDYTGIVSAVCYFCFEYQVVCGWWQKCWGRDFERCKVNSFYLHRLLPTNERCLYDWNKYIEGELFTSYGHTTLDIPDPIRTQKSSRIGFT